MLSFLAEDPLRPRPLKEIADRVGLGAGTCANILKTLQNHGVVAQAGPRQSYFLGPWIDHVSCKTPYRQGLIMIAEPEVARLAEETGETAILSVMQQGRRFVVSKATGNRILQVRHDFTFSVNPYHSASGRLLLAFIPREALEAMIAKLGLPHAHWPEVATLENLHDELARIRKRGYALRHDQEFKNISEQIHNIAYPVRNGDMVVASLALMIPAIRFRNNNRRLTRDAVRETSERISKALTDFETSDK